MSEAPHSDSEVKRVPSGLEDVQRDENRAPWLLNMAEVKLLGIAGVSASMISSSSSHG